MRQGAVMAVGLATMLVARSSFAQVAVDWQVSGSASMGVTDNVANTAESDDPDATGPQPDGFGSFSPAAQLQLETMLTTHTLGYAFAYNYYFTHPEANAYSNSFSYGLRADMTELSSMTAGLSFSQTTTSQFNLVAPASGSTAQPTTAGNNIILFAGGGLGFSEQVSESVTSSQSISATYGHTIYEDDIEDARTVVGSLSWGFNKAFLIDSLAIDQSNDMQYTAEQPTETGVLPSQLQVLHRARLTWSHTFSDEWNASLGAGVVAGYEVQTGAFPLPQPVALVSVSWANYMGSVGAGYSHDAQPNFLLREITLNDSGNLRFAIALPKGFDVNGTAAFQVTRPWLADGGVGSSTLSFLTDLAVGYIPPVAPVRMELRYQFSRQFPLVEGSTDSSGFAIATIQRNTVLFTASVAWPDAPVAGGAVPLGSVPEPTAGYDILGRQAPPSDAAVEEERLNELRERLEKREEKKRD